MTWIQNQNWVQVQGTDTNTGEIEGKCKTCPFNPWRNEEDEDLYSSEDGKPII